MGEHTELPWRFVPAHVAEGDAEVRHPDGWLICCTPSDELAKCIVAAANTQPAVADLVKALEECAEAKMPGAARAIARSALSRFRELEKGNV